MRHDIQILRVSPWSQLNEHEGEVEAVVDGRNVCCRLMLPSGRWDDVRVGRATAEIWLERSGDLEIVEPAAGRFVHGGGVTYEATGRIERIDGERLRVDCGFALDVDLDLSRTQQPLRSRLGVDRHLRVVGLMQLSFDLDDPA